MNSRRIIEGLLAEYSGAEPIDPGELDSFTWAYMEAILFTEQDGGDVPLDRNYTIGDFSQEALRAIRGDCHQFQAEHNDRIGVHDSLAGQTFWLARQRSGMRFKDRDEWPEEEAEAMDKTARGFGEVWFYVGDDGKIHQSGAEGDWRLKSLTPPNAKHGLVQSVITRDSSTEAGAGADDEDDTGEDGDEAEEVL